MVVLVPLIRMSLPFIFFILAIIAHMYAEGNGSEYRAKEKFYWVLTYIFGAIAIYLFFFSGIYNVFQYDPNDQCVPWINC